MFVAVVDKIWGKNDHDHALKFVILYFIHAFVLANIDTDDILCIHFDLIESDWYKYYPWGSMSFSELAKSITNKFKSQRKVLLASKFVACYSSVIVRVLFENFP